VRRPLSRLRLAGREVRHAGANGATPLGSLRDHAAVRTGNAGVGLSGRDVHSGCLSVAWGVGLGLVLGKPIGIVGTT
jgi:hypothetical protein